MPGTGPRRDRHGLRQPPDRAVHRARRRRAASTTVHRAACKRPGLLPHAGRARSRRRWRRERARRDRGRRPRRSTSARWRRSTASRSRPATASVTGLLGPNGAGKTTTLRMLYGVMRPDAGTIDGGRVDAAGTRRGAQARVGVLPDVYGLYPRLTAREHIRYFGELHGLERRGARASAPTSCFELLDMKHIADRRAAGYSHGERTKVALARALVHEPQNVLLDEPTNGLDVMSTRAVRAIVRRLQGRGPLRAVLEPRDAGSVGAVRLDRRRSPAAAWWPTARPTSCAPGPATTTSRTPSWRWPARRGAREAMTTAPRVAPGARRAGEGVRGFVPRQARAGRRSC